MGYMIIRGVHPRFHLLSHQECFHSQNSIAAYSHSQASALVRREPQRWRWLLSPGTKQGDPSWWKIKEEQRKETTGCYLQTVKVFAIQGKWFGEHDGSYGSGNIYSKQQKSNIVGMGRYDRKSSSSFESR